MLKNLSAQQIRLAAVDLISQAADPSAGGGLAAAIGSMVLRTGPAQIWLKTAAGDTAWTKFVQSFDWFVVKDYGATGDPLADDTAEVQAAINACASAGGGVVFFPPGTYCCSKLTITGQDNVQLLGCGMSSIIKWTWDAATAAGALLTISAGSDRARLSLLRFDGSGLTNPAASRANHLVSLVGEGGGVTEIGIFNCRFGGMVAASGDGIHVVGTGNNLVSRMWVVDNNFDGCSRYAVGVEQGLEFGWVVENYFTACETDIAFLTSASVLTNAIIIKDNIIHHTGSIRHAVRIEGDPTLLITMLDYSENVITGGFSTVSNVQYGVVTGNVQTSGSFASTDGVFRIFDSVTDSTINNNIAVRESGSSAGPCLEVARATTAPARLTVQKNALVNQKAESSFISIVDCTAMIVGGNLCNGADAGTSTTYGMDVQAVTVDATDILIGPGNLFVAAAGSLIAPVRFLANGANVSVVGNQGDNIDYGVAFEVGDGGGTFNGQALYSGNNFDSSVGDILNTGVTVRPGIGFNAGTFGANLFTGAGSPEGVVTARISSIYLRTDGATGTSVYYKETGTSSTGWIGIGPSALVFGTGNTTVVATAVYLAPGWVARARATEIQVAMTRSATIRNLRVQVATAGTASEKVTYTVRKNGADTKLTATLANDASGAAADTTHSFTVVPADKLSVSCVKTGVVVAGQGAVTAAIEVA